MGEITFRALGIDPGSQVTGYGVVEKAGRGLGHIVHGEIRPGKGACLTACLETIYDRITEVIRQSAPDALVRRKPRTAAAPAAGSVQRFLPGRVFFIDNCMILIDRSDWQPVVATAPALSHLFEVEANVLPHPGPLPPGEGDPFSALG